MNSAGHRVVLSRRPCGGVAGQALALAVISLSLVQGLTFIAAPSMAGETPSKQIVRHHALNKGKGQSPPGAFVFARQQIDRNLSVFFAAPEAGGFVFYEDEEGNVVCRSATPVEAEAMSRRDPSRPLRAISPLSLGQQEAGLRIILRGTPQLESFPEAKAAFLNAAHTWENLIGDPITVVVDVDFGPTRFGEPFKQRVLGSTSTQTIDTDVIYYPDVRSSLIGGASSAQEASLYDLLPTGTVPTDLGSTAAIYAPSAVFRAIGAIDPVADPDREKEQFGVPPSIGFNSSYTFDFDPTDGIDPDKLDFDAVAVHEIGHVLGFSSEVGSHELYPSEPLALSVWDLFRFRPGAALATFATAQRILSSGGYQIFFAGGPELALSTGRPDGSGGDGRQASHWKDDTQTGIYIGIMDPTIQRGVRETITDNDLNALDAFGFRVRAGGGRPNDENRAQMDK